MRCGAELGEEPFAHRIAAAVTADVLTHEKHVLVAAQCIANGFPDCIAVADLDRARLDRSLWHGLTDQLARTCPHM